MNLRRIAAGRVVASSGALPGTAASTRRKALLDAAGTLWTRRPRRSQVQVRARAVPRSECRRIVDAMRATAPQGAAVLESDRETLDPHVRRCAEHTVAPDVHAGVLAAMRSFAADLPGVPDDGVWDLATPTFLAYGPGDHFVRHRDDGGGDSRYPADVRARRYTLVCLLGDDDDHDGLPTFEGGALVVHEEGRSAGIRVPAGSLIAFPAGMVHEVRPIRAGSRYSAVTWLRR